MRVRVSAGVKPVADVGCISVGASVVAVSRTHVVVTVRRERMWEGAQRDAVRGALLGMVVVVCDGALWSHGWKYV